MIITDRVRRDVRDFLERGLSKTKTTEKIIYNYGIYKGKVDHCFIRNKKDIQKEVRRIADTLSKEPGSIS